jgi:(p)ppGpp synthase/HD superfamily hydrolase
MSTIATAIRIAAEAHANQLDKDGRPYILHPIAVMMTVPAGDAQIVAVLHDVVEDAGITPDELAGAGFSESVLASLRLVTHAKDEPYAQYVIRCKADPVARAVKLADLRDNTRPERALMRPALLERDARRIARYLLTYKFLSDEISEADYRAAMDEVELD